MTIEVPDVPRRDDPLLDGVTPSQRWIEYFEQENDAIKAIILVLTDLEERITALEP